MLVRAVTDYAIYMINLDGTIFAKITRDMTERRLAQQALAETWVRGPGAHAAGVATDNPLNSLFFSINRLPKHSKFLDTRVCQ
jgi:hypothetical protein